jgi:hypothetical protein
MGQTRKLRPGRQLFNDNPRGAPRTKGTGYGTAERARKTLKLLKGKPEGYKRQVVGTLCYRAKYHKYQTQGMRNAMKIYGKWLKKH